MVGGASKSGTGSAAGGMRREQKSHIRSWTPTRPRDTQRADVAGEDLALQRPAPGLPQPWCGIGLVHGISTATSPPLQEISPTDDAPRSRPDHGVALSST